MKKWSGLFIFLLIGILLVGCSSTKNMESTETSAPTKEISYGPASGLKLLEDKKTGKYLADAKGMALYYFTKDQPNTTNCSGECLQNWPAFYAENLEELPEGFNKDDFSTITRKDTGDKQTTYKGYPLYYFIKDKAPGDVNGQGVKDVWFIVNNETTFAQ
jgi:predicted lipoprotein with Yx(FWY)xxD motif